MCSVLGIKLHSGCISAPSLSSGQQSVAAASSEPPSWASCSGAQAAAAAAAAGSSQWETVAPSGAESSPPVGTEDRTGGCRRAEPRGEEGGEEGQSQAARPHQDSDDSDDDPILIPSTRFGGQGQRYAAKQSVYTVVQGFFCRLTRKFA